MERLITILFICFFNLVFVLKLNAQTKTVVLGATDWCPYTCKSQADGGIVTKYLTQVFKEHGIKLEVRFYPWIRAVKFARTGEIDGLLTAVRSEVPDLLLTNIPTMNYQTCYYGLKKTTWQYTGSQSLEKVRNLSVASGYGYGEPLDTYLGRKPRNVSNIAGDRIIHRMMTMLENNRVSIFAQDPLIFLRNSHSIEIEKKGCQEVSPFYIAFKNSRYFSQELIPLLDSSLEKASKELLPSMLEQYYSE